MANTFGGRSSSEPLGRDLSASTSSIDTCTPVSLLGGGRAGKGTFDMNREIASSSLEISRKPVDEDYSGA